jgi:4a-hydroxytetrahydrobiopterin dehydratase
MKLMPSYIEQALARLPGWSLTHTERGEALSKVFVFNNFHQTMAFVNAVAGVAHQLDHHPELSVSYSQCEVQWQTHDVQALTELDVQAATLTQALQS